ncbi:MAG: hypothetical protein IJ489_04865 [Clostridia bacterium]|nr:hypothetical protein [Clostridia bacterium]
MKYYDARIIEGCCVFSYNVEGPQNAKTPKKRKRSAEKTKKQDSSWQKIFLRFFLFLFAPFAFAFDLTVTGAKKLASVFRPIARECARARELTACILAAISSTALIPLIFLFL